VVGVVVGAGIASFMLTRSDTSSSYSIREVTDAFASEGMPLARLRAYSFDTAGSDNSAALVPEDASFVVIVASSRRLAAEWFAPYKHLEGPAYGLLEGNVIVEADDQISGGPVSATARSAIARVVTRLRALQR
jgi:hypothetical protein